MAITATTILGVLDVYEARYPADAPKSAHVRRELTSGADLTSRATLPGHITASATVLDPGDGAVLMIRHMALNRWLTPGGHLEPEDDNLLAAAIRELAEETGVSAIPLLGGQPFDLDIHPIPANPRKDEVAHEHYDFRFAFRAYPRLGVNLQAGEVDRWAWRPPSEALSNTELLDRLTAGVR